MKIGFSAFLIDKGKSGIGTYILNLLKSIAQVDHHNTYEIFAHRRDRRLLDLPFKIKTTAFVESPPINILWHNLALPLKDLDVVHIPSIRRIPLVKGCPIIATVHDMAPFILPDKYDVLRTFYHRQFLKRAVHRCDKIITVSRSTLTDLCEFTGYPEEKAIVIYPGIDHKVFYPGNREEAKKNIQRRFKIQRPFFVYVSRLEHPGKNHVGLIRAFEHFSRKYPGYDLLFAGAPWKGSESIRSAAHQSACKDRIHFLGFVTQSEIVDLYRACDGMVFPSLYEGFGFPVLEAMACGAPVACSNTSSLKEIGERYAELFNPNSPEEISMAMERLSWKGSDERSFYAFKFQWNETAKRVVEQYECFLNKTIFQ